MRNNTFKELQHSFNSMAKQASDPIPPKHPDYTFKKITYDGEGLTVVYNHRGESDDKIKLEAGPPNESFLRVWGKLQPYCTMICGLSDSWTRSIAVKSLKWVPKGIQLVFTRSSKLGGQMEIKTPPVLLFDANDSQSANNLPPEVSDILADIEDEAISYINGERGKGPLFDEVKEEK